MKGSDVRGPTTVECVITPPAMTKEVLLNLCAAPPLVLILPAPCLLPLNLVAHALSHTDSWITHVHFLRTGPTITPRRADHLASSLPPGVPPALSPLHEQLNSTPSLEKGGALSVPKLTVLPCTPCTPQQGPVQGAELATALHPGLSIRAARAVAGTRFRPGSHVGGG